MQRLVTVSNSFARPANATQYAAGDLVADTVTAGSVVPLSFKIPTGYGRGFKIREVHVEKDDTDVVAADFSVHFYSDSPTCTNGDNGAWLTTLSGYIGKVDTGAQVAFSDGSHAVNVLGDAAAPMHIVDRDGLIYALIVSDDTYTPASGEIFTVRLELEMFRGH